MGLWAALFFLVTCAIAVYFIAYTPKRQAQAAELDADASGSTL